MAWRRRPPSHAYLDFRIIALLSLVWSGQIGMNGVEVKPKFIPLMINGFSVNYSNAMGGMSPPLAILPFYVHYPDLNPNS